MNEKIPKIKNKTLIKEAATMIVLSIWQKMFYMVFITATIISLIAVIFSYTYNIWLGTGLNVIVIFFLIFLWFTRHSINFLWNSGPNLVNNLGSLLTSDFMKDIMQSQNFPFPTHTEIETKNEKIKNDENLDDGKTGKNIRPKG